MEGNLHQIADYARGKRGPIRRGFGLLKRAGIGERMVKTAVAAGAAWALARLVPENPNPYLAPLTAILVTQSTIAGSISYAFQRGIGIAIGILVAVIAAATIGIHGWSITIVVLASLAIGARLKLGAIGIQQVAVSATLVLLFGSTTNEALYAFHRVLDTIVGTAVALTLNAVIAPPSYVPSARTALFGLGAEVTRLLRDLAHSLETGLSQDRARQHLEAARAAVGPLAKAERALASARESVRYNAGAASDRAQLDRDVLAGGALERIAIQLRVITRTLVETTAREAPPWIGPAVLGAHYGTVLAAAADALEAVMAQWQSDGGCEETAKAIAEARRRHQTVAGAASGLLDSGLVQDWPVAGELIAVSGRLIAEIEQAAELTTRHA